MLSPNNLPEPSRHSAGSFPTEWALDYGYEGDGGGLGEALPGEQPSSATDERSLDDWAYHPTVSTQFG